MQSQNGASFASGSSGVQVQQPIAVTLPPHLFYPVDAETLDLALVANLNPGETVTLIDFTCPVGKTAYLLSYALFNNGLLAANYAFVPTLNGQRLFPYQGDGNQNLYLGLSADLGNNALRAGYAVMQPGQTLIWTATNNSTVETTMGVRVVGYLTQGQARAIARVGG